MLLIVVVDSVGCCWDRWCLLTGRLVVVNDRSGLLDVALGLLRLVLGGLWGWLLFWVQVLLQGSGGTGCRLILGGRFRAEAIVGWR